MVSKRVFDTEMALHATFDRFWGKWQIITYIGFSLGYAIIIGWLQHLIEYTCKSQQGHILRVNTNN